MNNETQLSTAGAVSVKNPRTLAGRDELPWSIRPFFARPKATGHAPATRDGGCDGRFALPSQSLVRATKVRYDLHITLLPPIAPDLITAYQARVVDSHR